MDSSTPKRRITAWRPNAFLALLLAWLFLAGCSSQPQTNYLMSESQAMDRLAAEPLTSQTWTFAGIPGTKISSQHYAIYTTIPASNGVYQRLLVKVLEADYARFSKLNPHTNVRGPLECYVFGDRPQWESFTRRRMGPNAQVYLQISAGGYCQEGVFAGYDLGREQTLSVIAHEAWHQYSWFAFKDRLPSWLEEGLATQNEAIEWDGVDPIFTPEKNIRRWRALREANAAKRLWPLADLIKIHAGQAIKRQGADVDAYYGQLWSLVLFLQHSRYRAGVLDMTQRAADGKLTQALAGTPVTQRDVALVTERWNEFAGPAYMRAYITPDLAGLEREYRQFVTTLTGSWPPKVPQ